MRHKIATGGLLFFGFVCPGLTSATHAQSNQGDPARTAVRVAVDPRVELISIIFRLAGNPEYSQGRVAGYIGDIDKHFGAFRDHPVVELARRLRRTRGVSYDACMSMAVHVSDASDLKETIPFDPHPATLDVRWQLAEAREFLEKARQFVEDTSFEEFVKKHQSLYRLTESRMEKVLDKHAHLEWFDRFFGRRPQASFTVILGLVNGGQCYGPRCRDKDGMEELFCVLGVWQTDDEGMPTFDRSMLGTVIHEFCHSYANPVIDSHETELRDAGQKIFPHVSSAMKRQAYGNWKTMMYESLVRACVVRYIREHDGALAAWAEIQRQKQREFLWMKELSDLLGEYETDRDDYPTLDKFAPRIVSFFDEYAKGFAEKQKKLDAKRPKVVEMTPANGAADVDPSLSAIKVVFDRPMQDGSWSMVGGGPNFPEIVGRPSYDAKKTVWTVSVKLKPNWRYQFMLNSGRFTNFRSADGQPLAPVSVSFRTGPPTKPVENPGKVDTKRPTVVEMTPANGAVDVDPSLSAIKVVFDRPMQDGSWSMVGGGPNFPEIVGRPSYDAKKTVWTVSVKLKPNWRYQFMLNSGRFTNFRSADGQPLAPVSVSFKTGLSKESD